MRRNSLRCLLLVSCLATTWICALAQLPAQEPDPAAVRDFNTTAALQNNGLYEKAAQKWEQFIKDYPQDKRLDKVHYYLGICQLHTKKFDEAIKTFQTIGQKYPQFENSDGALFNLGMARYQAAATSGKPEDWKAAAADFATVVQRFPTSPHAAKAYYLRGESLYAAGDKANAIESYRQLVSKFPDSNLAPDSLYYLGVTQQELNQLAEAAATYEEFLKKPSLAQHDLAAEIRLRNGICLFELKKFTEAEQRFAEVAKNKDYELADFAALRQGQCRIEQGKHEEAAQIFTELLQAFPQSNYKCAAQVAAGKCYYEAAKWNEAATMLKSASADAAAKPQEQAEACYWLGRTLLKQAKPQDALAVLESATQKFTTGEFAPYLAAARADALYDIPERRKESAAAYDQFLQKFPQHELAAQAGYMPALIALSSEDFAVARQKAEAFLANGAFAESPLRPTVLFIAGEAYLLGEGQQDAVQRQQAEKFYRELVEKFPQHSRTPRAILRIGWCLVESDKAEEAIKYLSGSSTSLADPDQKAEAQLLIGRSHSKLGRHQEAVSAFDQALAAKADWKRGDEVLLGAAQSLRELSSHDEAVKRLESLLAAHPSSPLRATATYQLGEIAQSKQQYDAAVQRYQQVLESFSQSDVAPAARYGLAAALLSKGDSQQALAPLDQVLSASGDPKLLASAQFLRGVVRQQLQQYDGAVQDLTAFLATNPSPPEALDARYTLAMCQIGQKKPADAAATLKAILAADKNYRNADRVRYELGHALLAQDKLQEASDAFASLVTANADSPLVSEAWFHVGRGHEIAAESAEDDAKAAKLEEAAKAFAAGLLAAKDLPLKEKLQYKLGDMRFRQQNYDEAAKVLLAEIQEFPQGELSGAARQLAGECLYAQEKYQEALPLFEKVAADKVEKYHARALYRVGTCALNLKMWPVAQTHFDALLKQFPKFEQSSEARYGLAFALQNQNQLDAAEKLYEQVTEETENETAAKARFMIGEIDFSRKKFEDAIEDFLSVSVGYPYEHWQGMARFETARCFMELGQNDKAIATFETMLEKHPQHERAADATRLLAELKK
jgi:TolA-binding protein